jgi:hypothetical protein
VFATAAQGSEILLKRDEYVRATAPLERMAKLRSREPVDEEAYMRRQSAQLQEWPPEAREALAPLVQRLQAFLSPMRVTWPRQLLLVRTDGQLEDGAAFTRANGAFLFDGGLFRSAAYFLAHEAFHVLSRHDPALRERLYAMIGFQACKRTEVPEALALLRITNPDAVAGSHSIRVRYKGQPVDALPYLRLKSADIDPAAGMFAQLEAPWLLVDRVDGVCKARLADGKPIEVDPENLEGLIEQVGDNTRYFLHAEEILADNFAMLFLESLRQGSSRARTPALLERLRGALNGG